METEAAYRDDKDQNRKARDGRRKSKPCQLLDELKSRFSTKQI
jgi:hypothetical protein